MNFVGCNRVRTALLTAMLVLTAEGPAMAQFGGPPAPTGPARTIAPIDLTGQWVSIVTEDWRFRMVTPPKGDFPGLALTPAARAMADAWDPAKDEAEGNECRSYGAAAVMRVPGRIRISWRDDSTLEVQTDAGRQTRVFLFGAVPQPASEPTWQGISEAQWLRHRAPPGSEPNGSLKVVTTGMKAGYLRKNGLPYSANAVITEYFDILHQPDGSQWLVVKTIVEDPEYLTAAFITSSNFRRQTDRRGWDPTPCSAR
jgi:hypothetical protein